MSVNNPEAKVGPDRMSFDLDIQAIGSMLALGLITHHKIHRAENITLETEVDSGNITRVTVAFDAKHQDS